MMESQDMAALCSALRGGVIRELHKSDTDLQFKVFLPELASQRGEGYTFFFCTLSACDAFALQPFRNESTTITDLVEINRLELRISEAEAGLGQKIKVFCAHRGAESGARLGIRAQKFAVWDEAFDGLTAADLTQLRKKG